MSCCEKFWSAILNIIFGLLQMILAPLLLVGWVWGCFWGVSFIGMSKEYYHDNKPFDDEPQNTAVTTQPGYGPNQWSTPPRPGGRYGVQPGPSHGYPPGGQYSGQINPAQGQCNQNQVVPSAPPAEPGYPQPPPGHGEPPPGYSEAPPPYDFKDPLPHKLLLF